MVVLSMENAPESLRGEITRWFLEIRAGVFVGTVTEQVRTILWEKVINNASVSGAMMLYPSNNEQGYELEMAGVLRRSSVDFEGITLIRNADK